MKAVLAGTTLNPVFWDIRTPIPELLMPIPRRMSFWRSTEHDAPMRPSLLVRVYRLSHLDQRGTTTVAHYEFQRLEWR